MKTECQCKDCIECCKHIPGIPLPDEIINIANYLKLSIKETLKRYFIRGYREIDLYKKGEEIYIPIAYPARKGFENKSEDFYYPLKNGECTFLKDNLCIIHKVKPFECKMEFACKPSKPSSRQIALKEWDKANKNGSIHKEIKKFLDI